MNSQLFFRKISDRNRKCNPDLIKQTPWLRYSPSRTVCIAATVSYLAISLTSLVATIGLTLVSLLTNTKLIALMATTQQLSEDKPFFQYSVMAVQTLLSSYTSNDSRKLRKNRSILKAIAEVLIMMGKQNIAIRGHVPEESNFHATISLIAKNNSILRDHLEHARPTAKYTSPEIQNELLDIPDPTAREHSVLHSSPRGPQMLV